jgi:hypothetical protein
MDAADSSRTLVSPTILCGAITQKKASNKCTALQISKKENKNNTNNYFFYACKGEKLVYVAVSSPECREKL